MALTDKPRLVTPLILFVLCIGIAYYYRDDNNAFAFAVVMILAGFGVAMLFNWFQYQRWEWRFWQNSAAAARHTTILQVAQEINRMDDKRFSGWVYIQALQTGDEADKAEAAAELLKLGREVQQAAEYAAQSSGRPVRRYFVEAIEYAKSNHGFLPALRYIGDDTNKRNDIEALVDALKAAGLVKASVGHQARIIGSIDAALEIARKMEGKA